MQSDIADLHVIYFKTHAKEYASTVKLQVYVKLILTH